MAKKNAEKIQKMSLECNEKVDAANKEKTDKLEQ
jgi:hypothetical protein